MLEVLKYSRRGKGGKLAGDKTIFLKYWKLLKLDEKDTKFNTILYFCICLTISNDKKINKSKQTILSNKNTSQVYLPKLKVCHNFNTETIKTTQKTFHLPKGTTQALTTP